MNKKFTLFFLMLSIVFVVSSCDQISALTKPKQDSKSSVQKTPDKIPEKAKEVKKEALPLADNEIALVGDWRLSIAEFKERLDNVAQTIPNFDPNDLNSQSIILDELIRQQLMVMEAEKQGIHKQADIKQAVEDFRRTLLVQELADQLTKDIVVTEEEANQYYQNNIDLFVVPLEYKVRELVVYTETGAKEMLVQLLQGADFETLAKERSKGASTENGGDLGYIRQAPFQKMQNAIETLNEGDVSSVFQGPEGYYIVKLEDKRGGEPRAFEEIKEDLIQGLTVQNQQQAVLERLSEVAQTTTIEVNQEYFGVTEENSGE